MTCSVCAAPDCLSADWVQKPCACRRPVALVPSSGGLSWELAEVLRSAALPIISESWSPHDRARGRHAALAIARGHSYALWVDDDMVVTHADCTRLLAQAEKHAADIMTGVYVCRHLAGEGKLGLNFNPAKSMDLKLGEGAPVVPIAACGFGFVVTKLDVFARIDAPACRYGDVEGRAWFLPMVFDGEHLGEDRSFSVRAREAGLRMFADCSIVVGHRGRKDFYPWSI